MIMNNTVYTKIYDAPDINKNEILRYAGAKESSEELNIILAECIEEVTPKLVYKVCWCEVPVVFCEDCVELTFIKAHSADLRKNLNNCSSAVLFAATVGIEVDRLIARYASLSPLKSLMFQAIGAERIESLCDVFNREITELKGKTKPRFSPGYGDFSVSVQRDIFRVLEPSVKIGLTLNQSMLMSPSKSVTALIGITGEKL